MSSNNLIHKYYFLKVIVILKSLSVLFTKFETGLSTRATLVSLFIVSTNGFCIGVTFGESITGKLVFESIAENIQNNIISINTKTLAKGIYQVIVKNNEIKCVGKVVVQ